MQIFKKTHSLNAKDQGLFNYFLKINLILRGHVVMLQLLQNEQHGKYLGIDVAFQTAITI